MSVELTSEFEGAKVSRPLTGCHLAEDREGFRVARLDGEDPAGGLASQEQLVAVGCHRWRNKTEKNIIGQHGFTIALNYDTWLCELLYINIHNKKKMKQDCHKLNVKPFFWFSPKISK